jgi:hypothetical protein
MRREIPRLAEQLATLIGSRKRSLRDDSVKQKATAKGNGKSNGKSNGNNKWRAEARRYDC